LIVRSKRTAQAIADGRVTQYRHTGAPLKVGHDYPVQPGKGKPALCRVHVHGVATVAAGEITFQDARREGYKTTSAFKVAWVQAHDARWLMAQEDPDDGILVERFDRRHSTTPVQLVVFEVVVDEPRFLASQYDILHGHTDRGEYTARPGKAIDDLEVVPDAVADAYARYAAVHAEKQRERFRNRQQAQRQGQRNARLSMFRRAG
jgi:hypothetical protein